jgi:hypothetical protein
MNLRRTLFCLFALGVGPALWACQPPVTPDIGVAPVPSLSASALPTPLASVAATPPPTASPAPTSTPMPSPSAVILRTYSTLVQPITSGQGCRFCHASVDIGTYAKDFGRRGRIAEMALSHGDLAKLSPDQVAGVQAWFAAGAPNDPVTF